MSVVSSAGVGKSSAVLGGGLISFSGTPLVFVLMAVLSQFFLQP